MPSLFFVKLISMRNLALLCAGAALILLIGCKADRQENESTNDEVFPVSGWDYKSPQNLGIDSLKMYQAIAYLEENFLGDGIHEMIIIKDGYAIFQGDSIDKVHGVWSVTKSVTSTLYGILQKHEKVALDDYVKEALPYLSAQYPEVQYRHFITLTSGYDALGASNQKHLDKFGFGDSSDEPWIPAESLFPPGAKFCYWDESMNVLAHAITRLANRPLDKFFQDSIAAKIGMDSTGWHWPAWQNARGDTLCGGSGCCNKALNISARQLARFGYLFLRKGEWNGEQVIPAEWIERATTNQVPAAIEIMDGPRKGIDARGCYGYNWWINSKKPDGTYLMPDTPLSTYFASGFNNNMLYIIPEWDLVLVRTGIDGNPPDKYGIYNQFFKLFSQALKK